MFWFRLCSKGKLQPLNIQHSNSGFMMCCAHHSIGSRLIPDYNHRLCNHIDVLVNVVLSASYVWPVGGGGLPHNNYGLGPILSSDTGLSLFNVKTMNGPWTLFEICSSLIELSSVNSQYGNTATIQNVFVSI